MYKKAQMFGMGMGGGRKIISFILGAIMLALGGIPLLFQWKIIKFTLPVLPNLLLWILGLAGGIFLIVDGFKERMSMGMGQSLMWISILVGIVLFLFGLIPILNAMKIIAFTLPALGLMLISILFIISGFLLFIGSFMGF